MLPVNTKITFLLLKVFGEVLCNQINTSTQKMRINKHYSQHGIHVIIYILSLQA